MAPADEVGPFTVPALLAARAATHPDRTAIMVPDVGSLTFGEWVHRSAAAARGLRDRGVARGDRVALLFDGERWIDYAVGYAAVQMAGGVAVPISAAASPAQVFDVLAHCEAHGVVHGEEHVPAPPGGWAAPLDSLGLDQPDAAAPEEGPAPGDLAQILYTSGTTGRPKGVAATHANLTHGFRRNPRHRPLAHSRHALHAFPIGTNAAQTMLLNAITAEPAMVALPRFDAETFCALVASLRVGTVFLVPAMAIDMVGSGALARHDLSSIVLLGSTGAPLPPAVAADLAAALPGAAIVNYYSSTESAPAQTIMVFDPRRPTSVGRPDDPDDIVVTDAAGAPLPAGEIGDVWLRSPGAPRSYYRDPDATAAVFSGGWTRMGDVGRLDEEGYLSVGGRAVDLIIRGGVNVYPAEVERALLASGLLADAAVVGVPSRVAGQAVAAAVVPLPGVRPELAALQHAVRVRLGTHAVPRPMKVVDQLPRNRNGKVDRDALKSQLSGS